jgi:hypothetical protein
MAEHFLMTAIIDPKFVIIFMDKLLVKDKSKKVCGLEEAYSRPYKRSCFGLLKTVV